MLKHFCCATFHSVDSYINHKTFPVWLETGVTSSNRIQPPTPTLPPHPHQHLPTRKSRLHCLFYILEPLNNSTPTPLVSPSLPATMTSMSDLQYDITDLRPVCSFKRPCSAIYNQWVALSLWEPTVEWQSSLFLLVWLWCHAPVTIMNTRGIYTHSALCHVYRAALSTNHCRHCPTCVHCGNESFTVSTRPQNFTVIKNTLDIILSQSHW